MPTPLPAQIAHNLFGSESVELFIIADLDLRVLPRLDALLGLLLVNGNDVVDQVH